MNKILHSQLGLTKNPKLQTCSVRNGPNPGPKSGETELRVRTLPNPDSATKTKSQTQLNPPKILNSEPSKLGLIKLLQNLV